MSQNRGAILVSALLISFAGLLVTLTAISGTRSAANKIPHEIVLGAFTSLTATPTPTPNPTATPVPSATPTVTPSPKPTTTSTPTPTPKPTPVPVTGEQLEEWFTRYAGQYSVNRDLLKKIAYCESRFRITAKNGPYAGLYQFHAGTWTKTRGIMNLDGNADLRFNAEESIKTAAFLISTRGTGAWPSCGK